MKLNEINTDALKEVIKALDGINYGSVEIVVQDGQITQISTRIIKKTNISAKNNGRVRNGISVSLKY
jgi:hypothetical protein